MSGDGDLRSVPTAAFGVRLSQAMGKDGLLTYCYLGRKARNMHRVPRGSIKIRSDMRDWHGGIRPAALAVAAAEAGWTDFNAVPAPVTAGFSIINPGYGVREVTMEQRTLRTGRTMAFSRTVVTDSDDRRRIIAVARGVGIKPGACRRMGAAFSLPDDIDDHDLPPLLEIFGGMCDADGH